MNESQLQTELEAMQASERVARENLRELARLVLVFEKAKPGKNFLESYRNMTNFAKGVSQ